MQLIRHSRTGVVDRQLQGFVGGGRDTGPISNGSVLKIDNHHNIKRLFRTLKPKAVAIHFSFKEVPSV
jgi:hypothetical protein